MARRRTAARSQRKARAETETGDGPLLSEDAPVLAPDEPVASEQQPDAEDIEEVAEQADEVEGSSAAASIAKVGTKTVIRRTRATRKRIGPNDGSEATIEELKKRREEARNVGKQQEVEKEKEPSPVREQVFAPTAQTPPRQVGRAASSSPSSSRRTPAREAPSADTDSIAQGRGRQRIRGSALKAEGTPQVESSLLILQKFQRRPRQPSVLRMIAKGAKAGDAGAEDDEDESYFDFDDASILMNSSPVAAPKEPADAILVPCTPIPNTQEEEADVAIEGGEVIESTQIDLVIPATMESTTAPEVVPASPSSPSELSDPSTSTSGAQKRKRTPAPEIATTVAEPPPPSSPPFLKSSLAPPLPTLPADVDSDESLSDVPSLSDDDILSSVTESDLEENDKETEEDILAPPLSSSDFEDDQDDEGRRPAKISKNNRDQNVKSGKRRSLTTSTLTSLLPRLKSRRPTHTGSDAEGDETPSRHNSRTPLRSEAASEGNKRGGTASSHSTSTKKTYSRRSLAAAAAAEPQGSKDGEEKLSSADKEDGDASDTTVVPAPPPPVADSRELRAAAKKFAEIDEWSMEFENVSQSTNDEEIGAW